MKLFYFRELKLVFFYLFFSFRSVFLVWKEWVRDWRIMRHGENDLNSVGLNFMFIDPVPVSVCVQVLIWWNVHHLRLVFEWFHLLVSVSPYFHFSYTPLVVLLTISMYTICTLLSLFLSFQPQCHTLCLSLPPISYPIS